MKRLTLLFPLLAALAAAGCYADVGVRPVAVHREVVAYEPLTYGDAIVYFDDVGMPYTYDPGGVVVYVPHSDARFHAFVEHYRDHRDAYRHWAAHHEQHHWQHGGTASAHARVKAHWH